MQCIIRDQRSVKKLAKRQGISRARLTENVTRHLLKLPAVHRLRDQPITWQSNKYVRQYAHVLWLLWLVSTSTVVKGMVNNK